MDLVRAAILGIVQGLSEFLPISSSGHLILVPALFGWPDQGLSFDVGLHCGTLLVLLIYFWRDWWVMVSRGVADLGSYGFAFPKHRRESRMLWLLALGSIPAAVTGLLLDGWIEVNARQPWLIAVMLAALGSLMWLVDSRARRSRKVESVNVADTVLIGLAQASALLPGVSRSGATMTMGMFRGLERDSAARFAFLLGTPAFFGAALLKAPDIADASGRELMQLGIGFGFAFLSGIVAVHYLMRFLRTRSLVPFVYYRYGVAVVTLVIALIRVA